MVLAAGTAVSMAAALVGVRLRDHARPGAQTRMLALAPAMGVLTLAFGGWYTLGAIGAVPYVL